MDNVECAACDDGAAAGTCAPKLSSKDQQAINREREQAAAKAARIQQSKMDEEDEKSFVVDLSNLEKVLGLLGEDC